MNTFFCKVEDLNKNQYILTDKYKQPLICDTREGKCIIQNFKKVVDSKTNIDSKKLQEFFIENTKIPCTAIKNKDDVYVSKPIDKEIIKFNIYDIATLNKDIVIKDVYDKQYTGIEIEKEYNSLFDKDKNNKNFMNKMKLLENDLKSKGATEPPLSYLTELFGEAYYYNKQFFTKEDTRKVDPNAPPPEPPAPPPAPPAPPPPPAPPAPPPAPPAAAPPAAPPPAAESNNYMLIGLLFVIVIVIVIAFYFYNKRKAIISPYPNPNTIMTSSKVQ